MYFATFVFWVRFICINNNKQPVQSVPNTSEFEYRSWRGVLDTSLCDNVCQWLATGQWFFPGTRVSSTNKTDHHDITEILLKMALNTITLTLTSSTIIKLTWRLALFMHSCFVIMCLLHAIYLICWIKCVHLAQDVWYMSTQTIFVEYFKIRHVCAFHVQMRYGTVNLVFLPVSKARTHILFIPIPSSHF